MTKKKIFENFGFFRKMWTDRNFPSEFLSCANPPTGGQKSNNPGDHCFGWGQLAKAAKCLLYFGHKPPFRIMFTWPKKSIAGPVHQKKQALCCFSKPDPSQNSPERCRLTIVPGQDGHHIWQNRCAKSCDTLRYASFAAPCKLCHQ